MVTYGGLPLTVTMKTEEQKINYLSRLFEETYIKDIIERNRIEKIQELNDLINILASAIGSLTNPSKIETTFKSIIQSDIGFRNARLGFRQVEETHLMENIIYNELRMRGFQVDVGVVLKRSRNEEGRQEKKQLEIDFVANLGSRRYYIQSAFSLPDKEKEEKEKASLLNVNDSFKKIIIVKDVAKVKHDENGITTMSIFDFLLQENSLEL